MRYNEREHWGLCAQLATSQATWKVRESAAMNGTSVLVWSKPYHKPAIATQQPGDGWTALGELRPSIPSTALTTVIHTALRRAELYDGTDAPLRAAFAADTITREG